MSLPLHPACELFPALDGDELRELADDIKTGGLLDPIVLHEGQILDGRNRYRACEMSGVEPRFREWGGEHGSPTSFVLATNLLRRHLTPSQRAAIGAEAMPEFKAEAKQRQRKHGNTAPGRANTSGKSSTSVPRLASEAAGAAVGVNERYVREAAAIKEADPDLFEQVKRGEKPLKEASREAGRTFGHHYSTKEDKLLEATTALARVLRGWTPAALEGLSPNEIGKRRDAIDRLVPLVMNAQKELARLDKRTIGDRPYAPIKTEEDSA